MTKLVLALACLTLTVVWPGPSYPQSQQQPRTEEDRRRNVDVCMTGQAPLLCRKDWLTAEQRAQVVEAERRYNLALCLTGQAKTLCRRDLLTSDELAKVNAAERDANRRLCMTGQAPTLCDRSLLSPSEHSAASAAEQTARQNAELARRRLAQGMELYRDVLSGRRTQESLTLEEQQLVTIAVRVLRASSSRSSNSECREARERARSAADEVASYTRKLGSCVDSDDFTDDCSTEFRRVRNAHSDYESAVSSVNSYCR
jgi:hypothetical protein